MEQQSPLTQLYKSLSLLALIASLVLVAFGIKAIWGNSVTDMSRTISVTGKGTAFATPDIATIGFSIIKKEKEVDTAQVSAEAIMAEVAKSLESLGVASKDITTTGYNANPEYDYNNICNQYGCTQGEKKLLGYEVSQSVEVIVRDTTTIGKILGALGSAQVSNLYGPSFEIEDENAPQEEARAKAIQNAQEEAERLADELGVRLGKMVSFSENSGGYPMPYARSGMMAMDAVAEMKAEPVNVTIPKGDQEITSEVTLTFKIR
jgi:uncharacterized protein